MLFVPVLLLGFNFQLTGDFIFASDLGGFSFDRCLLLV